MRKDATLFDRLGGLPALRAAVDEFYKRLLADPELFVMFEDVRMPLLKTHQLAFMKVAFSKIPDNLDVPKLIMTKHMRLFLNKGLNETHFDLVAQHLIDTLQHLKIKQHLIDEAIGVIAPLRGVFEQGGKLKVEKEARASSPVSTATDPAIEAAVSSSLLERLGGTDAVQAAVKGLMECMTADPELLPFFDNVNLGQMKRHQVAFIKIAFSDSPKDARGLDEHIRKSHARLMQENGLNARHFDRMLSHFQNVLNDLEVAEPVIDEAKLVLGKFRRVFEQLELVEC
ncbi:hypothetical protein MPSEU_000937300 [Mayamaea pseudoterrestris]|nr:hypothetical protein MPSEU_000937300 [Mayamaea pseudoterrestris]